LAHYIPIVLASKYMHHLPPLLLLTYRSLQFISIVEIDAFSRHSQGNNTPFNSLIIIKIWYLLERHYA